MACTDPGTRSPGHLVWYYTVGSLARAASMSFGFNDTVNITNIAVLQVEADRIAALIKPMVTNKVAMVDWGIRLPSGHVYYRAPLTTGAGVGTHALGGQDFWYSQTLAFVGHGAALTPGGCSGPITARLHICGALPFAPAATSILKTSDAALLALVNGINASVYVAADFYGRQGDITGIVPIQWNAHSQKKWGA